MRLYLVQHAQSKSEEEDPARPLSPEGQATAERMAKLFASLQPKVTALWHSDKLRARQTAEAFAQRIQETEKLRQEPGLAPLDDVEPVAVRFQQQAEDLMIVGHLPHLSRLASRLLVNDAERNVIQFQMAGIVCLGRDESGHWTVLWMVPPELAAQITGS